MAGAQKCTNECMIFVPDMENFLPGPPNDLGTKIVPMEVWRMLLQDFCVDSSRVAVRRYRTREGLNTSTQAWVENNGIPREVRQPWQKIPVPDQSLIPTEHRQQEPVARLQTGDGPRNLHIHSHLDEKVGPGASESRSFPPSEIRSAILDQRQVRPRIQVIEDGGGIPRRGTNAEQRPIGRPGGKDRHSKVNTARGLRDRRVRLSAPTAIQFFDVQDRLGFDQPSKAVDWLIKKAKPAIDDLAKLPAARTEKVQQTGIAPLLISTLKKEDAPADGKADIPSSSASSRKDTQVTEKCDQSGRRLTNSCNSKEDEVRSGLSGTAGRAESRAKARERARERVREKNSASKGRGGEINDLQPVQLPSATPPQGSTFSMLNSEDVAFHLPAKRGIASLSQKFFSLPGPTACSSYQAQIMSELGHQESPYSISHLPSYPQLMQQQISLEELLLANPIIQDDSTHRMAGPAPDGLQSSCVQSPCLQSLPFGSFIDAGITSVLLAQHGSLGAPRPALLSHPNTSVPVTCGYSAYQEHYYPQKLPNPQMNILSSHASSTGNILMTSQGGPGPPLQSNSVLIRGTLQSSYGPSFIPHIGSSLAENTLCVRESEQSMLSPACRAGLATSVCKIPTTIQGIEETAGETGLPYTTLLLHHD